MCLQSEKETGGLKLKLEYAEKYNEDAKVREKECRDEIARLRSANEAALKEAREKAEQELKVQEHSNSFTRCLENMVTPKKSNEEKLDTRSKSSILFVAVCCIVMLPQWCAARTVGCAGFGLLEGTEDEMDEDSCKEFVRRMGLPFLPRNGHYRDQRSVSSVFTNQSSSAYRTYDDQDFCRRLRPMLPIQSVRWLPSLISLYETNVPD